MISLQRWAWAALASGAAACSYYDSSLLEPTGQISKGDAGKGGEAGGKGGKGGSAGDGGLAGNGGSGDAGRGGAGQGGSAGGAGSAGQAGSGGTAVAASKETQVVGCTLKAIGPPKTPPAKKDGVEIALAVRSIDFGGEVVNGKPRYKSYGLDLDGYCSCPADFSCKGSDSNNPNRYCDSENGLDNAAGEMVSDFAKLVPAFGPDSINEGFESGKGSLLLQIKKYNGEANDDQIEFAILAGANTKEGAKWDGSDEWPIQQSSYDGGGNPVYVDVNAYVTDYVMVATVPGGKLKASNISVELTSPLLFATLLPPDGQSPLWRIDSGTIAARWKTQNILAQLAYIKDPLSSQYFCTNNPLYGNFKSQICIYADIPSTTQSQPNIPCDAISVGLRFRAVQAKIGAAKDVPDDPPNCDPQFDPGKDSCK